MMKFDGIRGYSSHGHGRDWDKRLSRDESVVIESSARIFHPENVRLGRQSYIGHDVILDGYHKGNITVGRGSWIGAGAYLHGAGGLNIGMAVGIGPRVTILTSQHSLDQVEIPILHSPVHFDAVVIEDGADIGAATTIVPGVTIGRGAMIGAGAVVTTDVPAFAIAVGCPAKVVGQRRNVPFDDPC